MTMFLLMVGAIVIIVSTLGVVYNKFQQFVEDLCKGVHNFTSDATSTLTVALTATANAPVATNSILANLIEVAYTNLSTRVITGVTAEHTTGTVNLTVTDLVLTASGAVASFQFVAIYNDDPTAPADPLVCWFDYGSAVVLANGETFTLNFATNLFTLA